MIVIAIPLFYFAGAGTAVFWIIGTWGGGGATSLVCGEGGGTTSLVRGEGEGLQYNQSSFIVQFSLNFLPMPSSTCHESTLHTFTGVLQYNSQCIKVRVQPQNKPCLPLPCSGGPVRAALTTNQKVLGSIFSWARILRGGGGGGFLYFINVFSSIFDDLHVYQIFL